MKKSADYQHGFEHGYTKGVSETVAGLIGAFKRSKILKEDYAFQDESPEFLDGINAALDHAVEIMQEASELLTTL
jgi:hypothetical protein